LQIISLREFKKSQSWQPQKQAKRIKTKNKNIKNEQSLKCQKSQMRRYLKSHLRYLHLDYKLAKQGKFNKSN